MSILSTERRLSVLASRRIDRHCRRPRSVHRVNKTGRVQRVLRYIVYIQPAAHTLSAVRWDGDWMLDVILRRNLWDESRDPVQISWWEVEAKLKGIFEILASVKQTYNFSDSDIDFTAHNSTFRSLQIFEKRCRVKYLMVRPENALHAGVALFSGINIAVGDCNSSVFIEDISWLIKIGQV